jgi:para-nitrobenzyl esterase
MPLIPWAGARAADSFAPPCAQDSPLVPNAKEVTKEDCLYLNVWTPEWPSRSPKPVMVWITGGGNFGGTGSAPLSGGDSLITHGVLLVTLNYRVGAFGFFSYPALTRESPHHASGNQGLLDQIAGLQWVRDNIANFGGDPRNVTVFGVSAGAIDIGALLASPLSRGLFARAIAESGAVVGVGDPRTLADAEQFGASFAARWAPGADVTLEHLRAIPAADILTASPLYPATQPDLGIVVDGYVLPANPAAVFAAGAEHKVQLLMGNNGRDREPGRPLPDLAKVVPARYGPLAERALALYGSAATDPVYGSPAAQWAGDTSFRCSAVQQLLWHTAAGNAGFEYEFARVAPGREAVGATHVSEVSYVFGTLDKGIEAADAPPSSGPTEVDRKISDEMQQYWTNFAKTGNPNGGTLAKWPAFDRQSRAYIQFTDAGPVAKNELRRPFCDLFMENVKRQR